MRTHTDEQREALQKQELAGERAAQAAKMAFTFNLSYVLLLADEEASETKVGFKDGAWVRLGDILIDAG